MHSCCSSLSNGNISEKTDEHLSKFGVRRDKLSAQRGISIGVPLKSFKSTLFRIASTSTLDATLYDVGKKVVEVQAIVRLHKNGL